MTRRNHIRQFLLGCFLVSLFTSSTTVRGAEGAATPDAAQRRLLDEVRLFTKANRAGIRSIRYSYTMDLNGLLWRSRVRRSGDRYYQASIIESIDGGLSLPAEIAWDGQRSFDRTRFQMLRISNAEGPQSVVTRPDTALFEYLQTAFGDTPPEKAMGASYRLKSASVDSEANEIRLEFEGPGSGMTLISYHDRSRNCMPLRFEILFDTGRPMYRLQRVKYARFETPAGTIYFPQEIDSTIYYDNISATNSKAVLKTPPEGRYNFRVSDIEMNRPLRKDEFQLTPYPYDDVLDGNTGVMRPAADPSWMQFDQIGFPFRDFAVSLKANGNLPSQARGGPEPASDPLTPPTRVDPVTYASWAIGILSATVLGIVILRHYRKG